MATLSINGKSYTVNVAPDTPLLWVIREHLQLTGTKFGCGQALCGACTVHLDGNAIRSCQTPVSQELEMGASCQASTGARLDEVRRLGHGRVGTEHILLGLAREGQGVAAGILDRLGIDLEQLQRRKLTALSQLD